MKILIIFLILTTLLCISNSFSHVNVTNCGTIDAAFMGGETIAMLNQSINITDQTCFIITASNIIFDCQGFNINGTTGSNSIGILSSSSNIIKNCNINGFKYGGKSGTYINSNFTKNTYSIDGLNILSIINCSFYDSGYMIYQTLDANNMQIHNIYTNNVSTLFKISMIGSNISNIIAENGFKFLDSTFEFNNNNLYNITINNFTWGFDLTESTSGLTNNVFNNIKITDTTYSFYMLGNFSNNIIKNSDLSNSNLYFIRTLNNPINNIFYNNYLPNLSKIISTDWSFTPNYFNYSTIGNYYNMEITNGKICFDQFNLTCDYHAQTNPNWTPENIKDTNSNSIFPSQSFISIILGIISILFYIIIN